MLSTPAIERQSETLSLHPKLWAASVTGTPTSSLSYLPQTQVHCFSFFVLALFIYLFLITCICAPDCSVWAAGSISSGSSSCGAWIHHPTAGVQPAERRGRPACIVRPILHPHPGLSQCREVGAQHQAVWFYLFYPFSAELNARKKKKQVHTHIFLSL